MSVVPMKKRELKVGVVGVGYWGPNLVRNLVKHPSVSVKYICDVNNSKLKSLTRSYPASQGTNNFSDLLNDPSLDAIVISTPVRTHYQLAKQALEASKHVLVTKPITTTQDECKALIDLADKKGKLLMVDHTFVYHPAVDCMRKIVKEGRLGQLLYFESARTNLGIYQSDVSVIHDLMCHDLSILNELIAEDPVELSCFSWHAAQLGKASSFKPDLAYLHLNYASGFNASIRASWLSPLKVRETVLVGSRQMIVYDDLDVAQKVKIFDKGVETIGVLNTAPLDVQTVMYREGDLYGPAISREEALQVEINHFVECIEKKIPSRTGGIEGLRAVRILEAAEQIAMNNRSWVTLSPLKAA